MFLLGDSKIEIIDKLNLYLQESLLLISPPLNLTIMCQNLVMALNPYPLLLLF